MKIRKAEPKELKRIAEIFRKEYRQPPYNENWSEETSIEKIENYAKRCDIFVLEIDKNVQGFIILSCYFRNIGKVGHINEIVINSEFQGKGFGKKLLKYSEDYLKEKGIKDVSLFSSNKSKAFKIYKKLGYEEKGVVELAKKI